MLKALTEKLVALYRDEEGASLVEYILLVALIAVVCIIAIYFLGTTASSRFSAVGSAIGGAPVNSS